LSPRERESWELCRAKRDAFVKSWIGDSDAPVQSIQEERLWLRKGLRPLLSGQPDEVLCQGTRVAVLDTKFGVYRVEDPIDNVQLRLYALLVSRDDATIEEVTCQILSPYFDFEPVTYGREELDQLYRSTLFVVASLDDPGEPVPGDHCHFCPARLICSAARMQAENATLAKVIELALGEGAAKLLEQIKRAQSLFKEVELFYKRVLEETPGAIPGWMLEPGDVRRSIERIWAKKNGVPANQAKDGFKQFLGPLLVEKRTAPSLRRAGE
jgi:hypothetical protein